MNSKENLLAEKTALERMIANLPETSVIDRMSLENRMQKVVSNLEEEYVGEVGSLLGTTHNPRPYIPKTFFGICMQELIKYHVKKAKEKRDAQKMKGH